MQPNQPNIPPESLDSLDGPSRSSDYFAPEPIKQPNGIRRAYRSHRRLLIALVVLLLIIGGTAGWFIVRSEMMYKRSLADAASGGTVQNTIVIVPGKDQTLTVNAKLKVANDSSVEGNLNVSGNSTVQGLVVNGDATLNGALIVAKSGSFAGTITASNITAGTINGNFIGTYSGNGTNLTNVDSTNLNGQPATYYQDASNLSSGTISDARLTSDVTLQGNSFNGDNELVALTSSGALPSVSGANLGDVNAALLNGQNESYYTNASNLNSGMISDTLLSSNVPLLSEANTFNAANTFSSDVTVQGTVSGQSAVFSNSVSALSFTQNGYAVCDTSGNCAQSQGVTGSGTVNTLAIFTGTGAIGDSLVSQSGSTVTVDGTVSAAAVQGDGSGLSDVNAVELNGEPASYYTNASNLVAGTVSDSLLSANVALLDQANTFTATDTFSNGAIVDGSLSGESGTFNANVSALSFTQNGNTVCDTSGNCAGVGGSVTGSGTTDTIALFTAAHGVGNSIITQTNGTTINVAGTLNATALTGDGSGLTNVNATELNSEPGSYYQDADNLTSGTVSDTRLSTDVTREGNSFNGDSQLVELTANGDLPSLDGSNLSAVNASMLQGYAASYFTDASNLSSGTVSDSLLSANVPLLNASNTFTATTNTFSGVAATTITQNGNQVCDTSGNCAGVGGGVTTAGGTTGTIALFTGTNGIGNSILTQASTTVTVAGTLAATTLQGSGSAITSLNGSNISSGDVGVSVGGTGDTTFTSDGLLYGNGSGALGVTTAGATGQCLEATTGSAPVWVSCSAAGSGATPGGSAGGDLSGTYPSPEVTGIYNQPLAITSLASPDVLIYNGTNWINAAITGNVTVNASGVATIATGAVTNADLVNSTISLTAGSGLSGGGTLALGNSTSLAVLYGSAANTAVMGNTTFTCETGTGNLTGGGSVITEGAGGTCASLSVVNAPTFSGLITGQAGLSVSGGDVNLNASSNYNTSINTGSSTGSVTIGNAATALVVTSTGFNASAVGAITAGTYNGQTISSSTSLTGTLATAGTIADGGNITIQGGTATLGTATVAGSIVLQDGSSHAVTISSQTQANSVNILIPTDSSATDYVCLQNLNNCGTSSSAQTIGTLDGEATPSANGATLSGGVLYLQSASTTSPGLVNTTTQSFAGNKTFTGTTTLETATNTTTAFQVQNATGTSALSVDTTNLRVDVGSNGTPVGQLYVSGNVPTSALSITSISGNPKGLAIVGHYAYLADTYSPDNLRVIDISNPASPVQVGVSSTLANGPQQIVASGHYVYAVANNGFYIFDVSNPTTPTVVGTLFLAAGCNAITVEGNYAYLGCGTSSGSLETVNISNPASPVIVGTLSTTNGAGGKGIAIVGRYLYATSYTGALLQIYDVSTPTNITFVSSSATTSASGYVNGVNSLVVQGRYAYVPVYSSSAQASALQIIDVSNTASPSVVGSVTLPSALYSDFITVQGRYAYIGNGSSSNFSIVDVSSPTSPTVIGTVSTTAGNPQQIVVQGRYLYITSGSNDGFQIFDLGGEYAQQFEAGGIETGTLNVDSTASIIGDTNIAGGLSVGTNAAIQGTLAVVSNATVGGQLSVAGAETVASTLAVTGAATFNAGLTVGVSSTTNGTITLDNSAGANKSIIQALAPTGTGNATYYIPAIAGASTDTICLQTLANCTGANGGSGDGNYIENQQTQQVGANFDIAASTGVAAVIQGASGQNIENFVSSGNSTVAYIGSAGNIYSVSSANINQLFVGTLLSGSYDTSINNNGKSGYVGLGIQAGSGQTANLLQLQDSNADILDQFNASGNLTTNGTNETFAALASPATPTLTTGTAGTAYYYAVAAYNAQGITLPSAGIGTTANSGVNISWTQVVGATGYYVYRATTNNFTAGATPTLVGTITSGTTLSFTDSAITGTGATIANPRGSGLTIQGWAGQQQNSNAYLLNLTNSTGASVASINTAGAISSVLRVAAPQFTSVNGTYNSFLSTSSDTGGIVLYTGTSGTGNKGLVIKSALAGQTADLQEFQDVNGVIQSKFNNNGQLTLGSTVTSGGTYYQGQLGLSDGTSDGFVATLSTATQLNNVVLTIPAEATSIITADTVCLQALGNCNGSNGGSGDGSYIFNQTTQQATANFNISGAGVIGSNLGVTGLSTLSGGLTATGATLINTTGTATTAIGNSTATTTLQGGTAKETLNGTSGVTIAGTSTAYDSSTTGSQMNTSSESFASASGWTTTGTGTSATATHTSGTTAITLTPSLSIVAGNYYEVIYTATGTSGTIQANIGGISGSTISNGAVLMQVFQASSTASLSFTPTTTYNGTISAISVYLITAALSSLSVQTSTGTTALQVRTGGPSNNNTFIGEQSGAINATGSSDTGLGYDALQSNISGNDNTANGDYALQNNTSSSLNTATGYASQQSNISGADNTSLGSFSLNFNATGSNNTSLGALDLYNTTSGSDNTAVGYEADTSNRTGNNDTAIGYQAGFTDSGGIFSTLSALQNATAIGAYAQVQANNSIILGSVDTATSVGIGTTVPLNTFSVSPLAYNTGTASQTTTVITGSGTTWTSAMVGDQMIFANGASETITGYTSATSLTGSVSQTESSQNYRLHYLGLQVTSAGNTMLGGTLSVANTLSFTGSGTSTIRTSSGNLSLQASGTNTLTLDTLGAGTIAIAPTNATSITIGNNASTAQAITVGSTNTGSSTTSSAGATSESLSNTGDIIKTTSNSATAFEIQNSSSADILNFNASTKSLQVTGSGGTGASSALVLDGGNIDLSYGNGIYVYANAGSLGGAGFTNQALLTTTYSSGISADTTILGTVGNSANGNISLNASNIGVGANDIQNTYTFDVAGTSHVSGLSTLQGGASIGSGSTLTNNGATVNVADAVSLTASSGNLVTQSVLDSYTTFNVTPNAGGYTGVLLPNPSPTTAGRIVYVSNVSSSYSFVMYGVTITAGATQDFIWNGSAWSIDGSATSTGNYIQNTTTQQTATEFNIAAASGNVAATIQGASGQDIADFYNSSSQLAASINQYGAFAGGAGIFNNGGAYAGMYTLDAGLTNTNTGSSSIVGSDIAVNLTGTANSNGNYDTLNGVSLNNVTAATGNTFNGIYVGTGYNAILQASTGTIINGAGVLQSAGISGAYANLIGTGALVSGSIASGFGTIATTNTIATTSSVQAGSLLSTSLDTATNTGLNIGTANSTALSLGNNGANYNVNIYSGSGGTVNIANSANAHTIAIGSTTGASSLALSAGSGGVNVTGATTIQGSVSATSATTGYAAVITNTATAAVANTPASSADGLLISVGTADASRTTGNYFIGFASGSTVDGKIQAGSGSGVQYSTSGADYAEYFLADPNNLPQAGELVSLSSSNSVTQADGTAPIGIISTNPGFVGNGPICNESDTSCDSDYAKDNVLVSLTGQVPARVSISNGIINVGDPITASAVSGIGQKATSAGQIVGYALTGTTTGGTIQVLVEPGYYNPDNSQTIQANNAILNSLTVNGAMSSQSINDSGAATVGSLMVTGSASIAGDLSIRGNLTVTGMTTVADLTVNGHIITSGSTPTVAATITAGSGAVVSISGNDSAGTITVTTGSETTKTNRTGQVVTTGVNPSTGDVATITFNKAYGAIPRILITPNDAMSAPLLIYPDQESTTSFSLGLSGQPAAGTTYTFNYFVVQ